MDTGTDREVLRRNAARAVMLTRAGHILLMRAQEPVSGFSVWFTPGGGLEPDEDARTGLCRELFEETGLRDPKIGPAVWTRHHTFDWDGQRIAQQETYYLVPVAEFTPVMEDNPSAGEASAFREFRWWTADEIAASSALFAPRLLAEYLRALVCCGPPAEPFDIGV